MKKLNWSIIRTVVEKEFKEILRDKRMRGIIFGAPLGMLFMFGYAVSTDVNNIDMGVLDEDRTAMSREIVRAFTGSGYFKHTIELRSEKEIGPLLDSGEIEVLLRMERGLSQNAENGRGAQVQIIVDGANSSRAAVISAYVNQIIGTLFFEKLKSGIQSKVITRTATAQSPGDMARALSSQWEGPTQGENGPSQGEGAFRENGLSQGQGGSFGFQLGRMVEIRERSFSNPSLTSRNFFLPGVVVMLVSLIAIMLTAMSIVKERELGTIEQIIVSPIDPYEYMLGKTIPFAVIAFFDMVMVTLVSIWYFGVPFNGSMIFLYFSGLIYIFCSLAIGLYISTISATQQQAMLSTFLYFFPALVFSGFIFPIYSMPETIQVATYIIPLRYFITIVRGVFLKGIGIRYLWPELLALLLIGLLLMKLSAGRFRRGLE
ncbi:MAG: ABC transporter permease [Spirochaetes bacterium]|nr:ABC transporter permease [Spirochaetota bacterium]